jgi:Cu-processing system permease protein
MKKIIKYVILDIVRNKIIIAYTLFLLTVSLSVFNLEDNASKGIISLLNVVLIIVPLVSMVFSTIYVYNAAEFIELLVSQPLKRVNLWLSIFAGLAISLSAAFAVGCGLPILLYAPGNVGYSMVLVGLVISVIFVAIALLAAVFTRDKAKGIGVSILLWFYFTLIFDGIVLFLLFQFMDYSLEKPMVLFSCLNPIDLGRILVLLKLDISALMGATSAVFRDFFGSQWGMMTTLLVMLGWMVLPLWWSVRKFSRKDL